MKFLAFKPSKQERRLWRLLQLTLHTCNAWAGVVDGAPAGRITGVAKAAKMSSVRVLTNGLLLHPTSVTRVRKGFRPLGIGGHVIGAAACGQARRRGVHMHTCIRHAPAMLPLSHHDSAPARVVRVCGTRRATC